MSVKCVLTPHQHQTVARLTGVIFDAIAKQKASLDEVELALGLVLDGFLATRDPSATPAQRALIALGLVELVQKGDDPCPPSPRRRS